MSSSSMAAVASSSSTTPTEQKYDVFISFRGADTRNNFLSHLYNALCIAKIKTFIDDDLRRGDDVPKALLRTIEESKISVVIFSENYAASKWCLNELVQIMECNEKNAQTVIPVFLRVEPTHVRHQLECFERALARHGDHPMIQRWRDVLTKAANISGWDSQVTRPEATLVKEIVSDILSKLCYATSSTFDGDRLVGMSCRFREIKKILGTISKEVRIIGFWGMGGIGKSTLAKAFFNHFSYQFEGQCMIENFRETCEKLGLNELLDKLVRGLLNDKNINEGIPFLENPFIWERLRRMRALIVLDDVNDFRHIQLLVGRRDYLGQGSIVVITSRDKQILKNAVDKIYEVPRLDDDEALCLFVQHAFKQEYPKVDHRMELSKRAINYAKGNPLALEIIGCHLFGRSNEQQQSALSKLERTPDVDIQRVLRISYDGLDNEEKNIFLNIACFFKWASIDEVKCFHDSYGYSTDIGICVLVDKSLITVNKDQVSMHDLLQEMGKEIARQECIVELGKRSRLFDHRDISHVLSKNTGSEVIEGISLNMHGIRGFSISATAFEMMDNLKFLKIYGFFEYKVGLLPQGLRYLPNELRYLYWYQYPLTYLPTNFHLENLVKLKMLENNLERLWNGRQNLPHLQVINLGYSRNLIEIPDLSMATNLQELHLPGCCKIKKVPKLPTKIKHLNLSSTSIEEIPSSIYCLTSLMDLDLGNCELKNLSESIYKLKSPQLQPPMDPEVNIHLRELTDSLSCLSALTQLDLYGNDFLEIPISIELLTNLECLWISNCKMLQSLPQLPINVQCMEASNCIALEEVASPLTTATRREFDFDSKWPIIYDFCNCLKLNQNALNSIEKHVELKLLHLAASSDADIEADILFTGDDIPDWFEYKSVGSSLIAKLPEYWCNSELFCLVFGMVVEVKDLDKCSQHVDLFHDFHIGNNIGDCSSDIGALFPLFYITHFPKIEDAAQSNIICLIYRRSLMIDEYRMKSKETGDALVMSVDFHIEEYRDRNNCNIKKCGIHLLYRHEIEDRCRTLRIESDSLSGTTQSVNLGCIGEDMEETVIVDVEGDGGSNDNFHNTENLVEFSAAIPMETDTNPQPEQPIQKQPQSVNTKTLPPVQKVYLRKRKRSDIGPLHGTTR